MSSNSHINLYASLISDDPSLIFQHLPIFEECGLSGLHFDVMDGSFVPRLGLYPELLSSIRDHSKLPIEVHLMMLEPIKYIDQFINLGADRVLVHYENLENPESVLDQIASLGAQPGIVLNPETNFLNLENLLDRTQLIMLMAINPGIPRHPFIPSILDKLINLRLWLDQIKPSVEIGIDGGVTLENAMTLNNSGANWLVCGSGTIFKPGKSLTDNIDDVLKALKK
jgi:ribulose-phosphate 3-epimerase